MAVTRMMRALTGSYLARPDPVAWLVAADLLEEGGDGRAGLWRNRGLLFGRLWHLVAEAKAKRLRPYSEENPRTTERAFGEVILALYPQKRRLEVLVLLPNRCQLRGYHWYENTANPDRYLTGRILELIDEHGDLMTKE